MLRLEFSAGAGSPPHAHQEIELLYVTEGRVQVIVEGETTRLQKGGMIVVNSFQRHSFAAEENTLITHFVIDYVALLEKLNWSSLFLDCNSMKETDPLEALRYENLRKMITQIQNFYYQKRDEKIFLLESLYYQLLYHLTSNFSSEIFGEEEDRKEEQRSAILEKYLKQNFFRQITLNDLAEQFHLSPAYLSRYFKKQMGMNFLDYLNQIRTSYAAEEIGRTNQSFTQIACNMGFSNITSFNKFFKKAYGVTPSEYRRKKRIEAYDREEGEKNRCVVPRLLSENFDEFNLGDMAVEQAVLIQDNQTEMIRRNWNMVINIGTISQLISYGIRNHLIMLHDELHFRYARIWGLYDEDSDLIDFERKKIANYSTLDAALDFLLEHQIKPHIELGPKAKKIVGTDRGRIYMSKAFALYESDEVLLEITRGILVHLVNRYGMEEVECWRFELWAEESLFFSDTTKENIELYVKTYLPKFDLVAREFRKLVPGIQIGGCGLPSAFGQGVMKYLIREWEKDSHELPDFVSMSVYPYSLRWVTEAEKGIDDEKIADRYISSTFMCRTISAMKTILEQSRLKDCKFYVTEWNLSIVSNNYVNDTCLKGAYIVQNLIDNIGNCDVMAYWGGTDLFVQHAGMTKCLNGAGALLSRYGIRKPAWYAFDFMNSLGKRMFARSDNYVVTDNNHGNWSIVCHNYTHLNYKYFLLEEGVLEVNEMQEIVLDTKRLKLTFMLPGTENELYRIRIWSINSEHGSALNEWIRMGCPEEMNKEDIEYLKAVSAPQMKIIDIAVKNGGLMIESLLEQNEIQLIQAMKLVR